MYLNIYIIHRYTCTSINILYIHTHTSPLQNKFTFQLDQVWVWTIHQGKNDTGIELAKCRPSTSGSGWTELHSLWFTSMKPEKWGPKNDVSSNPQKDRKIENLICGKQETSFILKTQFHLFGIAIHTTEYSPFCGPNQRCSMRFFSVVQILNQCMEVSTIVARILGIPFF